MIDAEYILTYKVGSLVLPDDNLMPLRKCIPKTSNEKKRNSLVILLLKFGFLSFFFFFFVLLFTYYVTGLWLVEI